MKEVYSGKSKFLYSHKNSSYLLKFKGEMKTSDGRYFIMPEKGRILSKISAKTFTYLNTRKIPTHYLGTVDDETLLVKKLTMLPFEFVVRRYAEGSYLKRNPKYKRYTRFEQLVFEVFYKEDKLDDPYCILKKGSGAIFLYDSKKELTTKSLIQKFTIDNLVQGVSKKKFHQKMREIEFLSRKIFSILKKSF